MRYPAEMVGLSKELPRFNGNTLLSLLLGPIYQYPSSLVGQAHRIPHWSLFSSKNSLLQLQSSLMFLGRVLWELLTQNPTSVTVSLR